MMYSVEVRVPRGQIALNTLEVDKTQIQCRAASRIGLHVIVILPRHIAKSGVTRAGLSFYFMYFQVNGRKAKQIVLYQASDIYYRTDTLYKQSDTYTSASESGTRGAP